MIGLGTGAAARLIAGLAGLVFAAVLAWTVKDRFHQKDLADRATSCAVAAGDEASQLDNCLPMVGSRIRESRQSRVCEEALLPSLRPESRFRVLNSCGAGVKHLVADRDAAIAAQEDAERRLGEARVSSAAAVARGEARGTQQQERIRRGSETIASAPRGADGRVACDADCLRRLAE